MKEVIEVSVIIPNYNYGIYIEECIRSVIESNFNHAKMEIIVVDDASKDNSISIVNKIKKTTDIPINLIKNSINSGLTKTRNIGIKNAKGEYLFFLDSDNYVGKECLKKHYECLINNEEYAGCYAPIQKFDNDSRELLDIFSNKPYEFNRLISGNYIDNMSMIKKEDLIEVGLYDEKMPCNGWEDWELWLRMGLNDAIIYFIEGEPLSYYRVDKTSMLHSMPTSNQAKLLSYIKTKYNFNESGNSSPKMASILNKISAKIYYSHAKSDFTEDKSLVKLIKLNNSPNIVSFNLPPSKESYNCIRFDLGTEPGLININGIEIKNIEGEVLWRWDKYTIDYKYYLFLFQNEELWPGKIVQLSTWLDPQFSISTNEEVQKESSRGISVEISLSSLTADQFELINNLTIPFSCISEKQFKDVQQRNESLSGKLNEEFNNNKQLLSKNESLSGKVTSLEDTLSKKEDSIIELQKGNQNLTDKLNEEFNNVKQLSSKMELLEKDILGLKRKNTELFDEQKNLISKLDTETNKLGIQYKLQNEVEKKLAWFMATYENRNIIGILKDVIFFKIRKFSRK